MNNYDDIINLEHYNPKYHTRMSMESRAAQFSPFAALTGYEEAVKETARVTYKKCELDDERIEKINNNLNTIKENINNKPKIKVIYFVEDKYKSGGKYINYIGNVRRIDNVCCEVIFIDGTRIKFIDIMDIDII